jgi:MerR family transcriptional regulator, thiopeptide resistance regulator
MYTVKQLSRLAGVTPRTLRYYDQIGLLRPTRVADNGYRYYGQEAVLRLQQIMFYRELDLPLEEIGRILASPDFDVKAALEQHRLDLRARIVKMERLIATVEHTLAYMKGDSTMDDEKKLFAGFSEEEQEEMAKEAAELYDPAVVQASMQKWKGYGKAGQQRILEEGNAIYTDMIQAMPHGPASPQVQAIVQRWREHIETFWTPSLDQLLALASMYGEEPRFKANFDQMHPDLADFMRQAVQMYMEQQK